MTMKAKREKLITIALLIGLILLLNLLVITSYFLFHRTSKPSSVDVSQVAKQFAASCSGHQGSENCYAAAFGDFTKKHTLQDALGVLHDVEKIDPSALYCHLSAHKIAIAEVEKNPDKWLDVLKTVDLQECSRGFFHGVVEGYTLYHPEFTLNTTTIPLVCSQIANKLADSQPIPDSMRICTHAAGHMLLVQDNANVTQAANLCSQLEDDLQRPCYEGVFMENMSKDNLVVHGLSEKPLWNEQSAAIQEKICTAYSGVPADACWSSLGQMYGSIANGSLPALHASCSQAPTDHLKQACEENGAGLMALMIAGGKKKQAPMFDVCQNFQADKTKYTDCIAYIVPFIINSSPSFTQQAQAFCDSIDDTEKAFCMSRVERNTHTSGKTQVRDAIQDNPISQERQQW